MFYFIQEAYSKEELSTLTSAFFFQNHMALNPGKSYYSMILLMDKDIANESIELGNKTSYMPKLNRNPLI